MDYTLESVREAVLMHLAILFRFRSAKEAEAQEALARQKGEKLPDTARFDSNCITPGTAFMVRLQNALKQFVQSKISSNPSWQKCRVILSGHEVSQKIYH